MPNWQNCPGQMPVSAEVLSSLSAEIKRAVAVRIKLWTNSGLRQLVELGFSAPCRWEQRASAREAKPSASSAIPGQCDAAHSNTRQAEWKNLPGQMPVSKEPSHPQRADMECPRMRQATSPQRLHNPATPPLPQRKCHITTSHITSDITSHTTTTMEERPTRSRRWQPVRWPTSRHRR